MKVVVIAARVLLGALFIFAGAMKVLPIHMPPMPPSDGATWANIMIAHKYMAVIGLIEVVGGLLVLVGRFVPLGLTFLGPIVVNIVLSSLLLSPATTSTYVTMIVLVALELFLIFVYRESFKHLFDADPLIKPTA